MLAFWPLSTRCLCAKSMVCPLQNWISRWMDVCMENWVFQKVWTAQIQLKEPSRHISAIASQGIPVILKSHTQKFKTFLFNYRMSLKTLKYFLKRIMFWLAVPCKQKVWTPGRWDFIITQGHSCVPDLTETVISAATDIQRANTVFQCVI